MLPLPLIGSFAHQAKAGRKKKLLSNQELLIIIIFPDLYVDESAGDSRFALYIADTLLDNPLPIMSYARAALGPPGEEADGPPCM